MRLEPREIIKRLRDHGYEAYICGGYVRDMLRGMDLEQSDQDIATNARPDELLNLFKDFRPTLAGDSFPVVYIGPIEVATYRKRVAFNTSGPGPRTRVEYAATLHDDLACRDLTVNAMAYDPQSAEVIDPFGGRRDLARGVIRFVLDPDARILEDPNRIVRACRFLALMQGRFDEKSYEALKRHGPLIARTNPDSGKPLLPPERISQEIKKSMRIPRASLFFQALHDIDILKLILPGLEACFGHPHGRHHGEDVFRHSMLCGDAVSSKYPVVKLAAYLHDVGKPPAAVFEGAGEVANFIGHDKLGADILRRELLSLRFSNQEMEQICMLAAEHMKSLPMMKPKSIRKAVNKWRGAGLTERDFIRICIADRRANLKYGPFSLAQIRHWLLEPVLAALDHNPPLTVRDLALSGRQLIDAFGLRPGPLVGWLQRELLERVLEDPSANRPQKLLALAESLLARKTE